MRTTKYEGLSNPESLINQQNAIHTHSYSFNKLLGGFIGHVGHGICPFRSPHEIACNFVLRNVIPGGFCILFPHSAKCFLCFFFFVTRN